MADTPPAGETVVPGDSQTTVTTPATPVVNADSAEVDRLRKEKEQADMRARQLENQLKAKEDAEREAEAKRLEEQEEYKALYEKTNADLQALRDTQSAAERATSLTQATETVFKDYPAEVVEVAKTVGLGLSDDGEAAQAALKEKLDAIKGKIVTTTPVVTSSNPTTTAPAAGAGDEQALMGRPKQLGVDTGQVAITDTNPRMIKEYINTIPAINQMRKDAGLST